MSTKNGILVRNREALESDQLDVLAALKLSRATYRKMMQNVAWATGYNADELS